MRLDAWDASQQLRENQSESDRRWFAHAFEVAARGPIHHPVYHKNWEIFLYGHAPVADQIGEWLDCEPSLLDDGPEIELSSEGCRRFSWSLFPSAAVVAVHRRTGTLVLLRDGSGFAPLYYAVREGAVRFSTNLAAIFASIGRQSVNTDKISEMLVFAHRGGGRTIWQNINVVAPGTLVRFDTHRPRRVSRFFKLSALFDLGERERLERQSLSATREELRQVIDQAMAPLRSETDVVVPCGGGVDSSFLGAYLVKHGVNTTFRCINQPEADRREQDWIEPLSAELKVPCQFAHVDRERFLWALLQTLERGCQPAVGPNQMGGYLLRDQAIQAGDSVFACGEMCDTVFGGLSGIYHLSPRFRALRVLSKLPWRVRLWTHRALSDSASWLLDKSMLVCGDDLAAIGAGQFDRAEAIAEAADFRYEGQSTAQRLCDMLTWHDLVDVPATLNHLFHERDELQGGRTYYPFADPAVLKLGLHMPHRLKYRNGRTKWLWRHFVSDYVGPEVAFRRKYAFPTLSAQWLNRMDQLMPGGFLDDLLSTRVGRLYRELSPGHASRWTLANIELWGRLHCWKEPGQELLERLL